jgi:alanine racemase
MTLALLSAGYGDGPLRELCRARAPALVNGLRARLLTCFMDTAMADVTGLDCAAGDEVVFFGRSARGAELSAREVGAFLGEEGVYLSSCLSRRVGRKYVTDNG